MNVWCSPVRGSSQAKANSPSFFAELTEFAPKLSEAQQVLYSETILSKQYFTRFLKLSNCRIFDHSPRVLIAWVCVRGASESIGLDRT